MGEFGGEVLDHDLFSSRPKSRLEKENESLKEQNVKLTVELKLLKERVKQLSNGVQHEEAILQRPVATVKYQYLNRTMRRTLEKMLSVPHPVIGLVDSSAPSSRKYVAPPVQAADSVDREPEVGELSEDGEVSDDAVEPDQPADKVNMMEHAEQGSVQYFETFCIDRFGMKNLPKGLYQPSEADIEVPYYESPINTRALPCFHVDEGGKRKIRAKGGSACFNCGGTGHAIRDCPVQVDDKVVRENCRLKREAANNTHKRPRYGATRYYNEQAMVQDTQQLMLDGEAGGIMATKKPTPESEIVIVDDAQNPPLRVQPPTLLVQSSAPLGPPVANAPQFQHPTYGRHNYSQPLSQAPVALQPPRPPQPPPPISTSSSQPMSHNYMSGQQLNMNSWPRSRSAPNALPGALLGSQMHSMRPTFPPSMHSFPNQQYQQQQQHYQRQHYQQHYYSQQHRNR